VLGAGAVLLSMVEVDEGAADVVDGAADVVVGAADVVEGFVVVVVTSVVRVVRGVVDRLDVESLPGSRAELKRLLMGPSCRSSISLTSMSAVAGTTSCAATADANSATTTDRSNCECMFVEFE